MSVDLVVTKQLPVFSQFPEDMELEEDQDLYLNCEVDEESEVCLHPVHPVQPAQSSDVLPWWIDLHLTDNLTL